MKKMGKFVWTATMAGISALVSACAGSPVCNNDACYDRKISSVDPYKKGDIAAWGTEKQVAEQEEEQEYREPMLKKSGLK